MRASKSLELLSLAALLVASFGPSAIAYDFHKPITIDRSRISDASCGATLANFPLLVSVTDPDLAHTGSGGNVTDLGGDDIVFVARDATTCGGPSGCVLDHEIERYVSATGELVAWVRVPVVNTAAAASDTVIYIHYGDSDVTSPTENPNGVWDTSFRGVFHLEEDVVDEQTSGIHDDSTSNAIDGMQRGNAERVGRIADGQDFDGVDDRIEFGNPGVVNPVTLSAWIKHDTLPASIQRYVTLNDIVSIRHDGAVSVGQLHFFIRGGGGTSFHLRANGVLTGNTWYHVAGTWDGTDQGLYLNGAQLLSQTLATTLDPISIPNLISQLSEPMDGIIDEVRISDTARSACWIDAEYDNQLDPGDIGAPGFYTVGAEVTPYAYHKTITLDRTKLPGTCGSTLTNFPMMFQVTDPDLANTGSGGDVTDAAGDDIIFRALDDATCGGAGLAPCVLDHEIERYVSTTGELLAWVRVPSVNTAAAASDTVIDVFYGNAGVTSPTENPAGVWDASYVGVWHLEEPVTDESTAGIHDDSTGGNDGAQRRNVNYAGEGHYAQTFDGTNDFVLVADADNLSFVSGPNDAPFSLSAWVRGDNNDAIIISKDAADREYDFWVDNTGAVYLELFDAQSDGPGVYTSGTLSTGWHHVAATYDGSESANGIAIYIDGVAQSLTDITVSPYNGMKNTTTPVLIGAYNGGGNAYDFNGQIDEARISNAVRSACWVGASYNNQVWPNKAVTPSPDPSPSPSSGFFTVSAATAVDVSSFEAHGFDGGVELLWETGSEIDNLGFNLYRSLSAHGPYELVTSSLIPGLGSSAEGARYRYRDTGLTNGITYYYELEDVETSGRTERHGPVAVAPVAVEEGSEEGAAVGESSPSAISYGDTRGNRLDVTKRGPHTVVLDLTTEGFRAYPEPDGTVRIEIDDFLEVDDNGLPRKRAWVEALAGRTVALASVREREVQRLGLRPAGVSEHELVASADGIVTLREHGPGRGKRDPRASRPQAARVVSVAFQGDVKKALVELAPLTWDASRQELRLAKKLTVTLSFAEPDRDERPGRNGRGRRSNGMDRRKRQGGVLARFATRAPGLYAVRYEEVFPSGSKGPRGRGLDASRLRLSRLGETVALHLEPDGSPFAPGSTLYFVSPGAATNPYGDEAVFELAYGISDGAFMEVRDAAPLGAVADLYSRRDLYEEEHLYQSSPLSATRWVWEGLFAPVTRRYPFSVSALVTDAGAARLELWLQGATDFPESPDHHVVVYVNGTQVSDVSWNGKQTRAIDVELVPGVLREGENLLEVQNVGDTAARYSMIYMDRFAVTYPRRARAENGRLEGRWQASGAAAVSGMSYAASIVDTTEEQPVWLTGHVTSGDGALRFRAESGRVYLLVDAHRARVPEVRRATPPRLTNESNQADYIVIGPRPLLEAAAPLLDHRRRQGLATLAVSVETIYAELGFGESRPEAIRDFLDYAYHRWKAPSPRYVLLLGDATYDFKDHYGTGIGNQVPPYMLETSYLWTASDPAYAAVNGDDLLPDLAIGRLPAANADEVHAMVEKILAYETGGASLEAPIFLVTDDPDEAGDFHADAEALTATVLRDRTPRHISLKDLGAVTARGAVRDAFDGGASLISYMGHGGIHLWANENLLDLSSADLLSPQSQQPLLLTMNCLNGYFHFPFFDALSEKLVKAEGKGAIAAFSPSGMSLNAPAHLYHDALLRAVLHGGHPRLGDAVLAAQEAYVETGAFPELLSIYHLFGDPALSLR